MRDMQAPAGAPPHPDDSENLIRDLRIRIGLLQTELEHLRREHAALKTNISHDIAMLVRHYVDPAKPLSNPVRTVDGVIFGGWDRGEGEPQPTSDSSRATAPDASSRETRRA